MGKLISVSCFSTPNYTTFSPSVTLAIQADIIQTVIPATARQIAAFPGVVNQIIVNQENNNAGESGAYLVHEAISVLVNAS